MLYKAFAVRIAYGSMSLFIAILHNVFLLYYVDIFVSVYKIDRNSFWLGEVRGFILLVRGYQLCFGINAMICYWKTDLSTNNFLKRDRALSRPLHNK